MEWRALGPLPVGKVEYDGDLGLTSSGFMGQVVSALAHKQRLPLPSHLAEATEHQAPPLMWRELQGTPSGSVLSYNEVEWQGLVQARGMEILEFQVGIGGWSYHVFCLSSLSNC